MVKGRTAQPATRWSLIVRAQGAGVEKRAALGELMNRYERFVMWLIRHHGHPSDISAEELKQEFLEGMLRRDDVAKLDRERGSFRAWLTVAVRRFLANEWDKWRTSRAGRQGTAVLAVELEHALAPDDPVTREFAAHVVAHALSLLRKEAREPQRFEALARFLPGPQMDLVELSPAARSLRMTQSALAKAVCLLRARFRELLRESIRDLLDLPPEVACDGTTSVECELARERAIDEELRELRQHFWS